MDSAILKKRVAYCRQVAKKTLDDFFIQKPPRRLPIPINEVADHYGFEVFELNNLNKDQRGIKLDPPGEGRKLIGVNSAYHRHNQRYTIGHEMGHDRLEHPIEKDCNDAEIKLYNQEADEFAAEILIPVDMLREQLKKIKDIQKLAQLFDVSEQALTIKLTSHNLLDHLL